MEMAPGEVNFSVIHPMKIRIYFSHSFLEGSLRFLGRIASALESEEDLMRLYDVSVGPSEQTLSDIEIVRSKIIGVVPLEFEPPLVDELEMITRPLVYQAGNFAAQGTAKFSAASSPHMNVEQMLHGRFFPVNDCKIWMEDEEISDHKIIHLNRSTMDFVHLRPRE